MSDKNKEVFERLDTVYNPQDLALTTGFDSFPALVQRVYEYTESGVNVGLLDNGNLFVSVIVEGTEAEYSTESEWPFTVGQFWQWVDDMEEAAKDTWDQTHGCDACADFWRAGGVEVDEFAVPIYSDCPECAGEGTVI